MELSTIVFIFVMGIFLFIIGGKLYILALRQWREIKDEKEGGSRRRSPGRIGDSNL